MSVTLAQAKVVSAIVSEIFYKDQTVVGIGITQVDDDYAVKINLRNSLTAVFSKLKQINGVPIVVEVTGSIIARTH